MNTIDNIVTAKSLWCVYCKSVINDNLICVDCNEYKLITIFDAIKFGEIEII